MPALKPGTVAFVWLVLVAGLSVYRAATQSITVDEAFVYLEFLDRPWQALFEKYDAAHHVLHTCLSWLIVVISRKLRSKSYPGSELPSLVCWLAG